MNIKMIAAVSKNGVMGDADKNTIPWQGKYPEDFKFFRKMTTDSTVIFGRKTFESIGRPLPKRSNVVITRQEKIDGVSCFTSLKNYIEKLDNNDTVQWICGGAGLYREGMSYASEIYLTLIPETVAGDNLVYFPWIDPTIFKADSTFKIENSELTVVKYIRV